MQGTCERIIRCLCSCLIRKDTVTYSQVNDQKHNFMSVSDHLDDQHRHEAAQTPDLPTQLSNSINNYFKEQAAPEQRNPHSEFEEQQGEKLMGSVEKEEGKDYGDVMSGDHPYYNLFKQKLAQLGEIFRVPPDAHTAHPETAFPLKMHCYQEGKTNVFKYFFTFPTDYDTYESISMDFELQKKFDTNIDEFCKTLQSPQGDAKMIYLSYKKVLMMSSRDFQYVRYTFEKDGERWSVCVSDMSREEVKGKVRGQMLLTATRILEKEGKIEVSVSSQVDMKIPLKIQIAKNRGFAEIRKYLDKVYQHIKTDEKSIL